MPASTLLVRIVVSALALAAIVGQSAYLDALTWHVLTPRLASGMVTRPGVVTLAGTHALVSIGSAAVAVLLAFRSRVGLPGAHALALAIGAWAYMLSYPGIVMLLRPDPGPLRTAFQGHFLFVETLGLGALLRFTGLFPLPRALATAEAVTARWPGSLILRFRSILLRPAVVWGLAVAVPAILLAWTVGRGAPVGDAGLHPGMDALRIVVAAAVVLNLRYSWVAASPGERRVMTWLLAALAALLGSVLLVIGGNIFLAATPWADLPFPWRPIVLDLGVLGFVLGLAATRLTPRRFDPVRIARGAAIVTSLAMMTLLSATILEVLLASGIFGPVALPTGFGAALAAAGIGSVSPALARFGGRILDQIVGDPDWSRTEA